MLYLLDANVLIDAHRKYYPRARVPEFWDWLVHHGAHDNVKIAVEIYEEITEKAKKKEDKDDLALWADEKAVEESLQFVDDVNIELVQDVVNNGYAPDLKDDEVDKIGRDPFLVAYALADPGDRCVVTTEVSAPSKVRSNRRVPDVCKTMGVKVCDTFEFVQQLDFSTNWNK